MSDEQRFQRIEQSDEALQDQRFVPIERTREGKLFGFGLSDIADVAVKGASLGILRGGDLPFVGKAIEESRTPDAEKGLGRKALEFAGEVGVGFLALAPLGVFRALTGMSIAAASKLAPLFGVTGRRATAALGEAAIGAGLATAQMGGEAVRKGELPGAGEAALQVGTGALVGGALGAAFPPRAPAAVAAALPEAPPPAAPMGDVLQPTLTPAPPGAGVGGPLTGLEVPEGFQGIQETIRLPQYQTMQEALSMLQSDVQQRAREAATGVPRGAVPAERPLTFQQPSERPGAGISPIQELTQGPPAVGERGRPLPPEPQPARPQPAMPQPARPAVGEAVLPELREDKFMRAAQARQAEILHEGDILDPTEALAVALKELQSEPMALKRVLESLKKADTTFTASERSLYERLRSTEFEKDLEAELRKQFEGGAGPQIAKASIFGPKSRQPVTPPAVEYLQEVLQQHGDLRYAVKEAFGAGFDVTGAEAARAALARYGIEYLGGGAYGSVFRIGNSAVKLFYDVSIGAKEATKEAQVLKVLENIRGIPVLGGTATIPKELLNGQYPMAALTERVVGELVPRRNIGARGFGQDVQVITSDHVTDLIRLGQDIAQRGVGLRDWHPGNVLFSTYKGHSLANRIDFGIADLKVPVAEARQTIEQNLLSMGEYYGIGYIAAHGGRPPAALPLTAPWQQRVLNFFGFC